MKRLPEVIGVAEIKDVLGVSRQRVNVIVHHSDFPKPIAFLTCGRIWRTSDIKAYAKTRNTKRGRPARAKEKK